MLKTCIICGKKFEGHHNSKCCGEPCRLERKHRRDKERYANTYLPTRTRKSHLVEKNAQARKMGITYGQLQAMKYAQEHRLEV